MKKAKAEIMVGKNFLIEIYEGYEIKETLKTRGYEYVGVEKKWVLRITDQNKAAEEYRWLRQNVEVSSPQKGMIDRLDKIIK